MGQSSQYTDTNCIFSKCFLSVIRIHLNERSTASCASEGQTAMADAVNVTKTEAEGDAARGKSPDSRGVMAEEDRKVTRAFVAAADGRRVARNARERARLATLSEKREAERTNKVARQRARRAALSEEMREVKRAKERVRDMARYRSRRAVEQPHDSI